MVLLLLGLHTMKPPYHQMMFCVVCPLVWVLILVLIVVLFLVLMKMNYHLFGVALVVVRLRD